MSRTIFAAVLGFGLVVAAGCNSKPSQPEPKAEQPPTPQPGPDAVPAGPAVYEMDPAKHAIPAGPVTGVLLGEKVSPEVRIEGRLVLRKPAATPGPEWSVSVELPPEALKGEPVRLTVKPDAEPGRNVSITYPKPVELAKHEYESDPNGELKRKLVGYEAPTTALGFPKGCSLTLDLGKRLNGKVAGKLYLAIPEIQTKAVPEVKDFFAGNFEAVCVRMPGDPPADEDVPYVSGSVTVKGAAPDAVLVVGYLGNPTPDVFANAATEIGVGPAVGGAGGSVRLDHDKPRVTLLTTGGGKDAPVRYEHSKLTPGRYFVFAALKNGPVAGKWVTVAAGGRHTADLTIDATQAGNLEVSVPLEVLGKTSAVPAEEPGQPPIDGALFTAITWQLNLERNIVARKTIYKGLAPGKYEIRAGGRSAVIEIVAGKTAELDLDKFAEPKKEAAKEPEPKKEPEAKPKG